MASQFIFKIGLCLLFLTCSSLAKSERGFRNLSTKFLHPTDQPTCDNVTCVNLVHTVASGPNDDLHYVYSTLGFPSVLIVRTTKDSTLSVDWKGFLSNDSEDQDGSLLFGEGEELGSALISFDEIYTFNDTNDRAKMDESLPIHRASTKDLVWSLAEPLESDPDLVRFVSRMGLVPNKTQTVTIEFRASSGHEESTAELPHLLLNSNLTEINVYLEDLYHSNFSKPRVALAISFVSRKNHFGRSHVVEELSPDDGLSPGAFKTINWLSDEADGATSEGVAAAAFVQWKPICYTSLSRSIQALTIVSTNDLEHVDSCNYMPASLATGFYGHRVLDSQTWMSRVNMTFGITGDGTYAKTNLLTWQLTFGVGSHPQGSVSLLIILLIAVGLGIPFLVLIAGAVYLPIRSRMLRRRGYEELSSSYPRIA